MKLQHLLSLTRKAVDEYQMIEENDRIAVGISGGKDSLTLLYALHGLRRFYPKPFTLHAVTVDLGFPGTDYSAIIRISIELGIPYTVVSTEIAPIIFQERKEGKSLFSLRENEKRHPEPGNSGIRVRQSRICPSQG